MTMIIYKNKDGLYHLRQTRAAEFITECARPLADMAAVKIGHPDGIKDPPLAELCPTCFVFMFKKDKQASSNDRETGVGMRES